MDLDEHIDYAALSMLAILNDICLEDTESRSRSRKIVPIIAVASLRRRLDYDTALRFKETLLTEIFPKTELDYSEDFDESKYWIIYGNLNESGARWLERLTMQLMEIVAALSRNRNTLEIGMKTQEKSLALLRHDLYEGLNVNPEDAKDHEFLAILLSRSFSAQVVKIISVSENAQRKRTTELLTNLAIFHALVANLFVLQDVVEY